MTYEPKAALALRTLFVGLWGIRVLVKLTYKAMSKSKVDVPLRDVHRYQASA